MVPLKVEVFESEAVYLLQIHKYSNICNASNLTHSMLQPICCPCKKKALTDLENLNFIFRVIILSSVIIHTVITRM